MFDRWKELLTEFTDLDIWAENIPTNHGLIEKTAYALNSVYNYNALNILERKIATFRPDLIVFGNLEIISPAALWAAKQAQIKTICLLHNYRPVLGSGLLFKTGQMPHGVASGAAGNLISEIRTIFHKLCKTYQKASLLLAPSRHLVDQFKELGLRDAHFQVMPNWVTEPGTGGGSEGREGFFYAGRLSCEKGILELLDAWKKSVLSRQHRLMIAGDGPLLIEVKGLCTGSVEFLGTQTQLEVRQTMSRSLAVIVPSLCEESFGLTAAEALSVGTPIITTSGGGLSEINTQQVGAILNEITPAELERAWNEVGDQWNRCSQNALNRFHQNYSFEAARRNFQSVLDELFSMASNE